MPGGYIPVLYWLELVDEIKNLLFSLVSRNVTGIHPSLSLVQTPHVRLDRTFTSLTIRYSMTLDRSNRILTFVSGNNRSFDLVSPPWRGYVWSILARFLDINTPGNEQWSWSWNPWTYSRNSQLIDLPYPALWRLDGSWTRGWNLPEWLSSGC